MPLPGNPNCQAIVTVRRLPDNVHLRHKFAKTYRHFQCPSTVGKFWIQILYTDKVRQLFVPSREVHYYIPARVVQGWAVVHRSRYLSWGRGRKENNRLSSVLSLRSVLVLSLAPSGVQNCLLSLPTNAITTAILCVTPLLYPSPFSLPLYLFSLRLCFPLLVSVGPFSRVLG